MRSPHAFLRLEKGLKTGMYYLRSQAATGGSVHSGKAGKDHQRSGKNKLTGNK
jgi:hypothetical protein